MTETDFSSRLANLMNDSIGIPGLDERQEFALLKRVTDVLTPFIPETLREFMLDASDGVSEEEAARYVEIYTVILNKEIDIEWVSERWEEEIIRPLVQFAMDFVVKGVSLITE